MVGRDRTTLARAETRDRVRSMRRAIPATTAASATRSRRSRRSAAHFGTLPWRDPATDAPLVIACQNFKGGVGKSTTCVNLAHYLALKGYRVLVIDTDSQATTTSMFGYVPDAEITQDETILPVPGERADIARLCDPTDLFSRYRSDPGLPGALRGRDRHRHARRGPAHAGAADRILQ